MGDEVFGEPVEHGHAEFLGRDPGVGGGHRLEQAFLAQRGKGCTIVGKDRAEWFSRAPFGMLPDHRLYAVEGEHHLEVHRLLGPQRAVVVEAGDALGHGHPVAASVGRRAADEVEDRLFHWPVVPRRQGVALRKGHGSEAPWDEGREGEAGGQPCG